jgi:putative SOS response-associated peptidase YedK
MCHHYRTREARQLGLKPEWDNEFSIQSNLRQLNLPEAGFYPLSEVPLIRLDASGQRELTTAEWGLLPLWWKPSDKCLKRSAFQRRCFNARSEDVHAKPTFRDAFKRRRCLMPADEFFEKGHYFHLPGHRPFAFAGLWERWRGPEGEPVESCTLLTTTSNAEVQSVGHHRMPVLLTNEEQYRRWLDPEITNRAPLEKLMQPTADGVLEFYTALPSGRSLAQAEHARSFDTRP